MIKKEEMLSVVCDKCNKPYLDKDETYFFYTIEEIELDEWDTGWKEVNGLHFCEDCNFDGEKSVEDMTDKELKYWIKKGE